jgi:hypothetical protein
MLRSPAASGQTGTVEYLPQAANQILYFARHLALFCGASESKSTSKTESLIRQRRFLGSASALIPRTTARQ